jgi:hypothetical protein
MTVSALGPSAERLTGRGKEFATAFGEAIGGPVEPFAVCAAAATEILLDASARSDGTRASVTACLLSCSRRSGTCLTLPSRVDSVLWQHTAKEARWRSPQQRI